MTDHPTAVDMLCAELVRERARADSFEAINRVQAASLAELAKRAANLRCQVADLADDALSSKPMPIQGLRNVTGRTSGLAESLSRSAHGYAGARTTDMLYPTVDDDLRAHNWTPRPDRGLDGTLPPIPISEMGDRRGYARGWHRGPQWITLWFTGPTALAYGDSSDHGQLTSVDAMRAVITSARSLSTSALPDWVAERMKAHTVPFDAPYVRVFAHLQAGPWSAIDIDRCDEYGVRTPNGTGNTSVWVSPSDPDFRLYVWGIGNEPAHVRYWAGPVVDMAHLVQITGQYR
ncbi:hypothetical protein [Actinocrispum wychmicini]|uniref:Uncharacterized protein n=1 Tax=Actinocrispum wychmicini TaxID=1213861 RepID=A0A4R2IWN6_9PSEU|nr:hypothetical protein [Actinocrispum wychmicini]TCO49657.1 hypothetical protein EV192_11422 [Actinocrispum wychmicini]